MLLYQNVPLTNISVWHRVRVVGSRTEAGLDKQMEDYMSSTKVDPLYFLSGFYLYILEWA